MLQSGKKAYEVSYALFRIGSKNADPVFKEYLERQALNLLDAAAREDVSATRNASRGIEYLVKFGADVGMVNVANAETIVSQLNVLNVAIAGLEKPATMEPVNLDDIFTGQEQLFSEPAKEAIKARDTVDNANMPAEIRQSAILDKIRQSGNCRLKDIQELLPDTSERTLRYDLQFLAEQNLVEKVGIGGPSVFYRAKQEV
jgi:hypothetical protein